MTCAQDDSPSAGPACDEPAEARAERCSCCGGTRAAESSDDFLRMLKRLAEMGTALAERVFTEAMAEPAKAPEAAAPAPKPSPVPQTAVLSFHRLSRTVRQSIMLSAKLQNDRLEREKKPESRAAAPKPPRRSREKDEVESRVKDAIERESEGDALVQETLERALQERLESIDVERDLKRYSPDEIARQICQEIGVEPDAEFGSENDAAAVQVARPPRLHPHPDNPDIVIIEFDVPDFSNGPHTHPWERKRPKHPSG